MCGAEGGDLGGAERQGLEEEVGTCANPHSLLLPLSRHCSRSLVLTKHSTAEHGGQWERIHRRCPLFSTTSKASFILLIKQGNLPVLDVLWSLSTPFL